MINPYILTTPTPISYTNLKSITNATFNINTHTQHHDIQDFMLVTVYVFRAFHIHSIEQLFRKTIMLCWLARTFTMFANVPI